MEELLTPVSTSYRGSRSTSEDLLVEVAKPSATSAISNHPPSTPEEALQALRSEPDFDTLRFALKYVAQDAPSTSNFRIHQISPVAAQLINTLCSQIVPNYWVVLTETVSTVGGKSLTHGTERKLLLTCLRSLSGLNATVGQIKTLCQRVKEAKKNVGGTSPVDLLRIQLNVLETLLHGDQVVAQLWDDLATDIQGRQRAIWHEVTALVAGGRILNVAAEATSVINDTTNEIIEPKWIADGTSYNHWLARNIIHWSKKIPHDIEGIWKPLSEFLNKALRLGHTDTILQEILVLILGTANDRKQFGKLLDNFTGSEEKMILNTALKDLSKRYLSAEPRAETSDWWKADVDLVSAVAGYLNCIIAGNDARRAHLINWLTNLSGAGIGDPIGIRRAALALFSHSKYLMEDILEKSLKQFGDPLYIKHCPVLQQEVHTQVILLSAGYVHRMAPLKLSMTLRSSLYLNAVSHRLAASSEKLRLLGMVVGEALSVLAEKPDKQMKFKVDELDSEEAQWYKSLTNVQDVVGSPGILKSEHLVERPKEKKHDKGKVMPVTALSQRSAKIVAIEELNDENNSEDEDLVPYAKPDSDPEDSDDDPTLVQRNKPMAPVYVRDLIVYLRDTENYDRQKLALSTASSLIRRKASFGTEVTAHVEELATLLVGLQDKYDMDNFQDMRLQGMIAILLAQPSKMGKWFSRTFFEGDYSVSQRASVLAVLSVAARELGGFKEQDSTITSMNSQSQDMFPSKRLPDRLHKIYATEKQLLNPVDKLSQQLSDTMIQPLAASLADKVTGPDVFKVHTFSSRLAVESRRKAPKANALSAIVADSFFFPLTGRFFAHFKAYGSKNVMFEPYLLSSFLKTLSLILHASGTSTLQLPQMTSEMWDLLLSLRTQGQAERSVEEAILFGFMTLLEVNEDKHRIAETYGRQLLETQSWVELVFQRIGPGSEEDDKIRAIAAGVLFKLREVVEKYQALLMGDLSTF